MGKGPGDLGVIGAVDRFLDSQCSLLGGSGGAKLGPTPEVASRLIEQPGRRLNGGPLCIDELSCGQRVGDQLGTARPRRRLFRFSGKCRVQYADGDRRPSVTLLGGEVVADHRLDQPVYPQTGLAAID
jgi:hypothetical protein